MEKAQLAFTFVTHAEIRGMSMLRERATNEEFERTIDLRLKNDPRRTVAGFATFECNELRQLVAMADGFGRKIGDRLYYVLDTDEPRLRHHVDVFATMPREEAGISPKTAWRRQRNALTELLRRSFVGPENFRDGVFSRPTNQA
jgi:hypothetical protein